MLVYDGSGRAAALQPRHVPGVSEGPAAVDGGGRVPSVSGRAASETRESVCEWMRIFATG